MQQGQDGPVGGGTNRGPAASASSPGRRSSIIQHKGLIAFLIVVALIVVFTLANNHEVQVNFLFFDVRTKVSWTLLGVAILGYLAGLITPRHFRRKPRL